MAGDHAVAEPKMQCTPEEMDKNRLPMEYRDYCAHKLIPLNKCRRKNLYMPWHCVDERHDYEKCQYDQYVRRMDEMKAIMKEEKIAARKAADEAAAAERAEANAT